MFTPMNVFIFYVDFWCAYHRAMTENVPKVVWKGNIAYPTQWFSASVTWDSDDEN